MAQNASQHTQWLDDYFDEIEKQGEKCVTWEDAQCLLARLEREVQVSVVGREPWKDHEDSRPGMVIGRVVPSEVWRPYKLRLTSLKDDLWASEPEETWEPRCCLVFVCPVTVEDLETEEDTVAPEALTAAVDAYEDVEDFGVWLASTCEAEEIAMNYEVRALRYGMDASSESLVLRISMLIDTEPTEKIVQLLSDVVLDVVDGRWVGNRETTWNNSDDFMRYYLIPAAKLLRVENVDLEDC